MKKARKLIYRFNLNNKPAKKFASEMFQATGWHGRPDLPMKSEDKKKVETTTTYTAKHKRLLHSHWRRMAPERN